MTTTALFDIGGDPVLHATGLVTGAISLRYGYRDLPARAWYLRVRFAPRIADTATADTAHTAVCSIDGTTVYSGSAHLWLSPGRRPPRTRANLPDEQPTDLLTDPWSPTPASLTATATAALYRLYELILTDWHSPGRWNAAQHTVPRPTRTAHGPGHGLASIHTLDTAPR